MDSCYYNSHYKLTGADKGMTIPVGKLLQFEKSYSQAGLNLVYSSQQLQKGRALSAFQCNGKSTTWRLSQELWPLLAVDFARE